MKLLTLLIGKEGLEDLAATLAIEATQRQVTAGKVAALAIKPGADRKTNAFTAGYETAICLWLMKIGENDPEIISQVLEQCRSDLDARDYFIGRANEL